MRTYPIKTIVISFILFVSAISWSDEKSEMNLRFADVFTDNMVLQRGKPIKCWGWAAPDSNIEVLLTQSRDDLLVFAGKDALNRPEKKSIKNEENPLIGKVKVSYVENEPNSFNAVSKKAVAGKDGMWEVNLGVHKATFTPTYLAVKTGDKSLAIQNLLIGEVWIASGQSNMEWAWTRDKMWENKGLLFNGLRYAKVRGDSHTPIDSFVDKSVSQKSPFEPWIVSEDGAVNSVSTVPYLFGLYLHRRLKVPVGVINIAMGGSFAREWCSREMLEEINSPNVNAAISDLEKKIEEDEKAKFGRGPSTLFNARLYPIRHMTVAGVIYLQGENEALCGDLPQYVKTFPGVIKSYRKTLGEPELPFGIITLQGIGTKMTGLKNGKYPVAREIHQMVHKKTPNTGYIVAHDVGGGIHPDWKRPIAERTVYWALRDVYKVLNNVTRTRIKCATINGDQALVEFESVKLKNGEWIDPKAVIPSSNDQQPLAGFMITGEDRIWYPGRIKVNEGTKEGLLISHPLVKKPVAVRYAWEGCSPGNLGPWVDPIPPFRSDDWAIVLPDELHDKSSVKSTPAEESYNRSNNLKNLELVTDLKVAVADSREKLIKRYAHPKGILKNTADSIEQLMQNFDKEKYNELCPPMRKNALYNIPCRYWQRDKYSPARRAKWSWFLERIIRLEKLPDEMSETVGNPDVKAKLLKLQKAVAELQTEIDKLPDPEKMDVDTMLDQVLPIMEREKKRLVEEEGKDPKSLKRALSKNPF